MSYDNDDDNDTEYDDEGDGNANEYETHEDVCSFDGCEYSGVLAEDESLEDVADNIGLHNRSGHVESNSHLVAFIYDLLRDHLTSGKVEGLVRDQGNADVDHIYTNGHLARYAQDVANRLLKFERARRKEQVLAAFEDGFKRGQASRS